MKENGVVSEKTCIVRTRGVGKGVVGKRKRVIVRSPGTNNKGIVRKAFVIRTGKKVGGRGVRMRLSAGGYGVHNRKGVVSQTLVVGTVGAVDVVCAEVER